MNKTNHFKRQALIASVLLAAPLVSHSAIVPDRTRVILTAMKFNHRHAEKRQRHSALSRTGVAGRR
ncbi:chaperone protein PapD [Salmonella enterica subsp. enterica]|nr:chaperone protein PapD [Salmonella enterica subsp. enterica] [Salmonella enterica subsp. enterica serovar Menston]